MDIKMQERPELLYHRLNQNDSINILREHQGAAALLTDDFFQNTVTLLNKDAGGNITANFYQLIDLPSMANPNEPPIPQWRAVDFNHLERENPDRVPLDEKVIIKNISGLMDIAAFGVPEDVTFILRNRQPAPRYELGGVNAHRPAQQQPQEPLAPWLIN